MEDDDDKRFRKRDLRGGARFMHRVLSASMVLKLESENTSRFCATIVAVQN